MTKIKSSKHHLQQQRYADREYSGILYDYKLVPWHKTYIDRINEYVLKIKDSKSKIKTLQKKTLVDLGSGQGYIAIEIAKKGINVVACDLSPESIKNINRYKDQFKIKNIEAIRCFAEKLPLKSSSADYVVANALLEHIAEEKQAIEEWKRILKPGGRMLISVPLSFKYVWPFFWPLNYLHDRRIGHLRRYDLQIIQDKFRLKVLDHFYTGHPLKVIWAILAIIFRTDFLAEFIERYDRSMSKRRYGASNIVVVMEKSK